MNDTSLITSELLLKEKIIKALSEVGFEIGSDLNIKDDKSVYREIQLKAKQTSLKVSKKFIVRNLELVKKYCRNGSEINPEGISLELREVKSGSLEETLFKWWNLVWWSMPYQHPYGRQMRFLLWDTTHNAPFGLIYLQSPILNISVLIKYLELEKDEIDTWLNRSMYAQRIGALPPYNDLLGGKMVALAVSSNEVREAYCNKYRNRVTIIRKRELPPDLLFITTTSAFGRSSIYNRLKYNGEEVAISLGYTSGYGTFHIPDSLYEEIIEFLKSRGINARRGLGSGTSRKLRLISRALSILGIPDFTRHGIQREVFIFPLVRNLKEVIHSGEEPIWIDRPFNNLVEFWKERWAIPRAKRIPRWKEFDCNKFFREVEKTLEKL
jgi:hypothetical protein